jgi:hypothetical protein
MNQTRRWIITGLLAAKKVAQACGSVDEVVSRLDAEMDRLVAAAPVPDSGPETSKAAARSMQVLAGSLRFQVLQLYLQQDLTDEEAGDAISHPRIWPRCSELRSLGFIEPTGATRVVGRTGRQADVCQITDAGRSVLRHPTAGGAP